MFCPKFDDGYEATYKRDHMYAYIPHIHPGPLKSQPDHNLNIHPFLVWAGGWLGGLVDELCVPVWCGTGGGGGDLLAGNDFGF